MDALFWAKVDRSGGPAACWPWRGSINNAGYGVVTRRRISTSPILARRRAFVLAKGPIPEGRALMHTCDNPPCVNPIHLEPGSIADNNADARRKGRFSAPPIVRHDVCPQGHPLTPDNRAPNGPGKTTCRACKRARGRVSAQPLSV